MNNFELLNQFNPWWAKGSVPKYLLGKHNRPQIKIIQKYINKRFIVLLYGLRRVGKTTLLYKTIQYLLEKKTKPTHILYFSFDEKIADIREIISIYQEKILKQKLSVSSRFFFFFDEIQKLPDWQSQIKLIYDLNPNIKIFLSGSTSASLQKRSRESLAGRILDIFVKPLSFREFLDWKKIKIDSRKPGLFQEIAMPVFMDYLRKGGFPEITNEKEDMLIRNYLKNTVLERIIYRDLAIEFDLRDTELLQTLVELVTGNPGMILNVENLAKDLRRTKVTINNYLNYLSYALLIRKVKNLRSGFLVSSRKAPKIYPTNPAFCFAYREDFYSDIFMQKIAEVATADILEAKNYYRNGFEVDFVLKSPRGILPVEIKYGNTDYTQLHKFIEISQAKRAFLVTKDCFESRNKTIKSLPLWYLALKNKIY